MKKNLFALAITTCTALSVLLSSCSITKRHYVSGYYVSHNSKQAEAPKSSKPVQEKPKQHFYATQNVAEKSNVNYTLNTEAPATNENLVATSVTKTSTAKPKNEVHAKKPLLSYSLRSIKAESIKGFKNEKVSKDSLAGDALSLFWIIILLLLILWLIAILSGGWGLGGFVHIILVIALVLLILWLLRII